MVLWALQKSFDIISILKPAEYAEVAKKLILSSEEVNKWRDVLDKMELEISPEGILE
jgi:trehalose/maltose hydrolase-like predicted phosphorylase